MNKQAGDSVSSFILAYDHTLGVQGFVIYQNVVSNLLLYTLSPEIICYTYCNIVKLI